MKKILFILPTLHGGGAEKVISTLFTNFNKKKYLTKLLIFDGSKRKYLTSYDKRKNVIDLKKKKITYGSFKFFQVIRKIQPDVIISTVSHLNLFLSILKIFFPIKTKLILRESNFISYNLKDQSNSFLMKIFYKIFYNSCNICLVFSKKHKIDVLRSTNINKDKIKIVENPINIEEINYLSKKKIKKKYIKFFPTNTKKFLILGSLSYQKGIDIILNSLKFCKKNFIINIIGKGSDYNNLKNIIRKEKLEKKVNLIPFQNNPFPYIKSSDSLLFPSRFEGMSNVILETLTIGKPIYYFNNPGASTDLLKKFKNNYILKSQSPQYISKVIDNVKLNKIKNYKKLKKYDLKNILTQYEKIIDDLF